MYKICQSERSAQRQKQLENGLLELLSKRHYEDISVCDLCAHLGIPRKTFYRYFSGKEGALYALIDHTMAEFFAQATPNTAKLGTALGDLDLFFLFWYQRKPFLDAFSHSGLSGILTERAHAFALREGHLPSQMKSLDETIQGIAMAYTITGLMAMILQWHRQNFSISPEEMTHIATSLLTHPIIRA